VLLGDPGKTLEMAIKVNVYVFMCRNFFGMSSDFPFSQLMTKGDDKTSLFYVSPTLKQLIDCNQTVVNVSIIHLFSHPSFSVSEL